jgi:hypothetical protein
LVDVKVQQGPVGRHVDAQCCPDLMRANNRQYSTIIKKLQQQKVSQPRSAY